MDDDRDSLFGSPPSSPPRGRSPALALPSGRSQATENVGTIALPGSLPRSELPINPPASRLSGPRSSSLQSPVAQAVRPSSLHPSSGSSSGAATPTSTQNLRTIPAEPHPPPAKKRKVAHPSLPLRGFASSSALTPGHASFPVVPSGSSTAGTSRSGQTAHYERVNGKYYRTDAQAQSTAKRRSHYPPSAHYGRPNLPSGKQIISQLAHDRDFYPVLQSILNLIASAGGVTPRTSTHASPAQEQEHGWELTAKLASLVQDAALRASSAASSSSGPSPPPNNTDPATKSQSSIPPATAAVQTSVLPSMFPADMWDFTSNDSSRDTTPSTTSSLGTVPSQTDCDAVQSDTHTNDLEEWLSFLRTLATPTGEHGSVDGGAPPVPYEDALPKTTQDCAIDPALLGLPVPSVPFMSGALDTNPALLPSQLVASLTSSADQPLSSVTIGLSNFLDAEFNATADLTASDVPMDVDFLQTALSPPSNADSASTTAAWQGSSSIGMPHNPLLSTKSLSQVEDPMAAAALLLQLASATDNAASSTHSPAVPSDMMGASTGAAISTTISAPAAEPAAVGAAGRDITAITEASASTLPTSKRKPAGRPALQTQEVLARAKERRQQLLAELDRARVELWETTIEQGVLSLFARDVGKQR